MYPAVETSIMPSISAELNHLVEKYFDGSHTLRHIDQNKIARITEELDSGAFLLFISNLQDRLSDATLGYVSVPISPILNSNTVRPSVAIAVISAVIFSALAAPTTDSKNGTPFTLYKSSADNISDMRKAGIHFYQPDEKLGFHNDAIMSSDSVGLADYIGLTDLFIGYKSPGNFY